MDVVIEYPLPQHCNACGIPLMAADAVVDKRRQVFDIPVARYQVTEHRTPQVHCTCGQLHQSQFPENVTEVVQYGPYGVHATRGMLAIAEHGIMPKRIGPLVHDCWGPYWQLDCEHALCNAHLLRELTFLHETTGQSWPKRMMGLLTRAHTLCEAARQDDRTALSARQIWRIFTHYEAILLDAHSHNPHAVQHNKRRGRVKQTQAFNLMRRMCEHTAEVLRFVTDLRVPFTNNLGERAIRMPKVKQKISGCFRTLISAQNFCTIRSYLDTMHKQGHNLFEVLRLTFMGQTPMPASG